MGNLQAQTKLGSGVSIGQVQKEEDVGASGLGYWVPGPEEPIFNTSGLPRAMERFRETLFLVQRPNGGTLGVAFGGRLSTSPSGQAMKLVGILPPLFPEWLGNSDFCRIHGLRFPYLAGAMATGIGSTRVVIEMARAGMMGFFGSAGLSPRRVEQAIDEIQSSLQATHLPYGINFIHFPMDPSWEEAMVDLFFSKGVTRVEASAFMRLTPALVRYCVHGLHTTPDGKIRRKNFAFAKLSRPEVAEQFMNPAPELILRQLLKEGKITETEAKLAGKVPLVEDIIVEADSGGHTDNRPLMGLMTTILSLGKKIAEEKGYEVPFRIGAGGGLGTPTAVAAAFALGASFVLTGSINQGCVEAGTSDLAKAMLARAKISDVMMAPAADMFEMGIKVQVLKKGTMWPVRANKLYQLYKSYASFDQIPEEEKKQVEKEILRDSFENVWSGTKEFFLSRDPGQVEKAEKNPKHKMALVFRWYLGMGSRWAVQGVPDRQIDYQIWCGPAQGAFNEWAEGSFLEDPKNRSVAQVGLNLMEGAAAITRAQQARTYGLRIPDTAFLVKPKKII